MKNLMLIIFLLFPILGFSQNYWFNSYPQDEANLPTIVLNSITNTGGEYCSYLWTANATFDGGSAITEKGFCWNTYGNPTTADNKGYQTFTGTGSFNLSIPFFIENTTYYGRAYAINSSGTAYSNQISFTTSNKPDVSTTINYTCNTVMDFIYTVNNLYSQNIVTRTFAYGINSVSEHFYDAGSGNGNYTWHITGLSANTTYKYSWQIRTNNCDVVNIYNSTFTTPNYTAPTVTTDYYNNVTSNSAYLYGTTVSQGGTYTSERGIVYSTSANPTLSDNILYASVNQGAFYVQATGLSAGTTYHFRTFATNCIATSYGSDMSFTTTGGTNAIAYLGSNFTGALISNPATTSYSISSSSKILVVSISVMNLVAKNYGVPTFGGVAMTQVGSYSGSYPVEFWYLENPPTGTQTLSIPNANGDNLQVISSWYSCSGSVVPYAINANNSLSTSISNTVTIPSNKYLLTIDAVADGGNYPNHHYFSSCSDNILHNGTIGGAFSSMGQYQTFYNISDANKTMTYSLGESLYWYDLIVSFVGN